MLYDSRKKTPCINLPRDESFEKKFSYLLHYKKPSLSKQEGLQQFFLCSYINMLHNKVMSLGFQDSISTG